MLSRVPDLWRKHAHEKRAFDTKHKAVIEVFMPKCNVNQTYGGIYHLLGLFERFGRSVLISQK
jgi:hypothetical protein